jgi:hemoglobin
MKPMSDAAFVPERVSPSSAAKIGNISEDAIRCLVDRFYAKVRADSELAPVFANAIADDRWAPHLAQMYDFWSSVMLTTGRYKGNPVAVHMAVAGMAPHLFARWLNLFGETCAELFEDDVADAFRAKAARIADSLKLALYYRPTRAKARR